jgi:hypothetical protein
MRQLSVYLTTHGQVLKKHFYAERGAIEDTIRSILPPTTPPFTVTYARGAVVIHGPPALKSELYLKRGIVTDALKKHHPNLRFTDIR